MPNEERLASEIDLGNQSVLVSGYVEHHVGFHPIGTSQDLLDLSEARPFAGRRNAVPTIDRWARVGTSRLEFTNRLIADNVHVSPDPMFP